MKRFFVFYFVCINYVSKTQQDNFRFTLIWNWVYDLEYFSRIFFLQIPIKLLIL